MKSAPWKVVQALSLVFAAMVSQVATAQSAYGDQTQRALLLILLLDEDLGTSRLGARSMGRMYPRDVIMMDYVAECLHKVMARELTGETLDVALRYMDVLAQTKNPRYRDVLTALRERILSNRSAKSKRDRPLRARMDENVAAVGSLPVSPYVPGSVDFTKKKAESLATLARFKSMNRSYFKQIKHRTSLSDVVERIGAPDSVSKWHVRSELMVLHYKDVGMLLMSIDPGHRYVVMRSYPEMIRVGDSYRDERFEVAQILGSANGRALVQYYKSQRASIPRDRDAMYILVRRVLELPAPENDYDKAMNKIAMRDLQRLRDSQAREWVGQMKTAIKAHAAVEKEIRKARQKELKERRLGREPRAEARKRKAQEDEQDFPDDAVDP